MSFPVICPHNTGLYNNFCQELSRRLWHFWSVAYKIFYCKTSEKLVMRWSAIPMLTYSHTETHGCHFVVKIKAKPAIRNTSDLQTLEATFKIACNIQWNHDLEKKLCICAQEPPTCVLTFFTHDVVGNLKITEWTVNSVCPGISGLL